MYFNMYERRETFKEKIERLEETPNEKWLPYLDEEDKERNLLFHGIRFYGLERLECIFKIGKVLPMKDVPQFFESYDGQTKSTGIFFYSDNANKGKYVSVMPRCYSTEYETFVEENIYLAFNGNIPAYRAHYLRVDEYDRLEIFEQLKRLYSYARNEYMVEDGIDLENLVYIGVNTIIHTQEEIDEIIKLMKHYKINVPLIDSRTNKILFDPESIKLELKKE